MSLFDGPEYASYIALCRELRLERSPWRSFDAVYDARRGSVVEWGWWTETQTHIDQEADIVWLPRLDQWLAMLEEAGVNMLSWARTRQGGYGYVRERDCDGGRCDEMSSSHWHEDGEPIFAPTHEEAVARLWMALTGRTVTSG